MAQALHNERLKSLAPPSTALAIEAKSPAEAFAAWSIISRRLTGDDQAVAWLHERFGDAASLASVLQRYGLTTNEPLRLFFELDPNTPFLSSHFVVAVGCSNVQQFIAEAWPDNTSEGGTPPKLAAARAGYTLYMYGKLIYTTIGQTLVIGDSFDYANAVAESYVAKAGTTKFDPDTATLECLVYPQPVNAASARIVTAARHTWPSCPAAALETLGAIAAQLDGVEPVALGLAVDETDFSTEARWSRTRHPKFAAYIGAPPRVRSPVSTASGDALEAKAELTGAMHTGALAGLHAAAAASNDDDVIAGAAQLETILGNHLEARVYETDAGTSFWFTNAVPDEHTAMDLLRAYVPPLPGAVDTKYRGAVIGTGQIGKPMYFTAYRGAAIVATDLNDLHSRIDHGEESPSPGGDETAEGARIEVRLFPGRLANLIQDAKSPNTQVRYGPARAIEQATVLWRASSSAESISISGKWAQ